MFSVTRIVTTENRTERRWIGKSRRKAPEQKSVPIEYFLPGLRQVTGQILAAFTTPRSEFKSFVQSARLFAGYDPSFDGDEPPGL